MTSEGVARRPHGTPRAKSTAWTAVTLSLKPASVMRGTTARDLMSWERGMGGLPGGRIGGIGVLGGWGHFDIEKDCETD